MEPFVEDDEDEDQSASDSEDLSIDDDEDDDPAETYFRRLGDGRLRRPRKVSVVKCTTAALSSLRRLLRRGQEEEDDDDDILLDMRQLKIIEEKILRRSDDGNPIGREAAIEALAKPAIQAIDGYLASATLDAEAAVSLKLFLDECHGADDSLFATTLSLGLWQPLRAASSCAATPPPPLSQEKEDDPEKNGRRRLEPFPLTFFENETAQLLAQQRKCACCGDGLFSSSLVGVKNFEVCRLLDALVCTRRCHDDAARVLPWRATLAADFRAHRVSKAAAKFLDDRQREPVICLPASAPVFQLDARVNAARNLRVRLAEVRADATLHGRKGAIEASKVVLSKLGPDRVHLALGPDYWSIQDLMDATKGSLIALLSEIIADATEAFASAFADDQLLRDLEKHLEDDDDLQQEEEDLLSSDTSTTNSETSETSATSGMSDIMSDMCDERLADDDYSDDGPENTDGHTAIDDLEMARSSSESSSLGDDDDDDTDLRRIPSPSSYLFPPADIAFPVEEDDAAKKTRSQQQQGEDSIDDDSGEEELLTL